MVTTLSLGGDQFDYGVYNLAAPGTGTQIKVGVLYLIRE